MVVTNNITKHNIITSTTLKAQHLLTKLKPANSIQTSLMIIYYLHIYITTAPSYADVELNC